MEPPNFLNTLSRDTTVIIKQMLQPTKIYLVYYTTNDEKELQAIFPSLDEAVEFMLSMVSMDMDRTFNEDIRNVYNKDTKTWTYEDISEFPFYCNEFDIEERPIPCKMSEICIIYGIDRENKKLYRYENENQTRLEVQPESLLNFNTSRMRVN